MNPMNEAWVLLKARQSQRVYAYDDDWRAQGATLPPALYNEGKDRAFYERTKDDGSPIEWIPVTNKEGDTELQYLTGDDFDGDGSIEGGYAPWGGRAGVRTARPESRVSRSNEPERMWRWDDSAEHAMGFEQGYSANLGKVRGAIANLQNKRALRQNAIPQQSVFQPR